jgi:hypothetical protein
MAKDTPTKDEASIEPAGTRSDRYLAPAFYLNRSGLSAANRYSIEMLPDTENCQNRGYRVF